MSNSSSRAVKLQSIIVGGLVLATATVASAQTTFVEKPVDPYRDLNLSEFKAPANPYIGEPSRGYVWGCAFFSNWNLNVDASSGVDFVPQVGAIQITHDHYAYIVKVVDSSHWLVDEVTFPFSPVNGKRVWDEQSVVLEDAATGGIRYTGSGHYDALVGIVHPPKAETSVVKTRASDRLTSGDVLTAGQKLISGTGTTILQMQPDGNLVLLKKSGSVETPIWSSKTQGHPGAYAALQPDGNFVIYYKSAAIWSTKTFGWGPPGLVVQDDQNVVIYNFYYRPIWATNTATSG